MWSAGRCALMSCSHAIRSSQLLSVITQGVVYLFQGTRTQKRMRTPPHHSHMSCWIRAMLVSRVIYMTVCNLNSSLSAQQKPKHLKHHTKAKLSLTRPWRAPYVCVCVWSMLLVVFLIVEYLHLPRPVHLHGP